MKKQGRHAHFIGVCGVGMSAVAQLLCDDGWSVSGSDDGFYPPISTYIKSIGIKCLTPYKASNIPLNTDIIVIGKHKKLVPESNPEVKEAMECGIPVKSYPEVLEQLTKGKESIVIAGSFGKSTTTTLLSWVLHDSGVAPSYLIGALPRNSMPPARLSDGRFFVLEGDEYPSSNWDTRSKFSYYNATHLVLTSCEYDHIDVFPTHKDYLDRFVGLVKELPSSGTLFICLDNGFTQKIAAATTTRTVTYSTNPKSGACWNAKNIQSEQKISFELTRNEREICRIESRLFGLHNVQNIVAVCAVVLDLGLITPAQLRRSIKRFQGTHNRMENISKNPKIPIYKDIASSGPKAKASLRAIRSRHPKKHITLIFEPYSQSFRHEKGLGWYRDLFVDVDTVLLLQPKKIGQSTNENRVATNISEAASRGRKDDVVCLQDRKDVLKYLADENRPTDVIVVMSSGNSEEIVATFQRKLLQTHS